MTNSEECLGRAYAPGANVGGALFKALLARPDGPVQLRLDRPSLPIGNCLLNSLSGDARARFAPHLEVVDLKRGQVMAEAGSPIQHAVFPHSGLISYLAVMDDGRTTETVTVGHEGFTGHGAVFGDGVGEARAVVQIEGTASMLPVAVLRRVMDGSDEIRELLQRYVNALLVLAIHSIACNSLHSAEQRLCRWLLKAHNRVEGDTYGITQEALSELLGVRRATVGEICGTLQRAGLIHYQRGMITIADRPAIEQRTCECFHKASRVYRKLYRADDVGLSALVP